MSKDKGSVILVTNAYPFGGGEVFIEYEIDILAKNFSRVFVVPLSGSGKMREMPANCRVVDQGYLPLYFHGIILWRWILELLCDVRNPDLLLFPKKYIKRVVGNLVMGRKRVAMLSKALRLCGGGRVIIYHYWLNMAVWHSALAKRWNADLNTIVRRVSRAHRSDLYFGESAIPFRRRSIEGLDAIYAISDHGARYLQNAFPEIQDKIYVSRLGIQFGMKRDLPTAPQSSPPMKILSLSFIRPVKRLDLLAEALGLLEFEVEWTHIGDGPDRLHIENLAGTVCPNVRTRFLGHLSSHSIHEILRSEPFHAIVNVSSSEGVPVSLMEAMSYGIPAVAFDVGGNAELVMPGGGVLLPANGSARDVSDALLMLWRENSEGQKERRRAASESVVRDWNAAINFPRFISSLRDVTGCRP